jgi:hypothetical protein
VLWSEAISEINDAGSRGEPPLPVHDRYAKSVRIGQRGKNLPKKTFSKNEINGINNCYLRNKELTDNR